MTSADSCKMRRILRYGGEKIMLLIAAVKCRAMTEACNWPVLMDVECVQSQS